MSPNEQPSRRSSDPLQTDATKPTPVRVGGTLGPTAAKPTRSKAIWAWIALPALLAVVLAGLTMSMFEPGAGQTLGNSSPTGTVVQVAFAAATASPTVANTATANGQNAAVATVPAPTETATVAPTETAPPPLPTVTAPPPTEAPTNTPEPTATEVPATAIPLPAELVPGPGQALDPVTGLVVEEGSLQRKPVVVMIDNHPDARPQSGLNSSDMVIEALAEGGITRFQTFFLSGNAGTVGPVRSARPYFVEWAYAYQPFFVHCGGSWEAIDLIEESNSLRNVDCFDGNMPFWRSNDRAMPHNLYISTDDLWSLGADQGLGATPNLPNFGHSPELPAEQRPGPASVSFTFSSLTPSEVTWNYDPETNNYLRLQGGYWHRDANTGEVVNSKNLVVLWTNVWDLPEDYEGRLGTDTIGENTALIMRDGQFEWGYWKRDSVAAPLQLMNGNHEPMALAPGRTWFEVLGIGNKVAITGR